MAEEFLGLPSFMWEGIFNIAVTLGTGLIVAFVTTFYLKKKDEVTRVAGLILEKRVNSCKYILDFLGEVSQKTQLNNGKEEEWYQLLRAWVLTCQIVNFYSILMYLVLQRKFNFFKIVWN